MPTAMDGTSPVGATHHAAGNRQRANHALRAARVDRDGQHDRGGHVDWPRTTRHAADGVRRGMPQACLLLARVRVRVPSLAEGGWRRRC